jgi:hypothetical protein
MGEEDVAALRAQLRKVTKGVQDSDALYRISRYICRAAWKTFLLATVLHEIKGHHKISNSAINEQLLEYTRCHADLFADDKVLSFDKIVASVLRDLPDAADPEGIPQVIVTRYRVTELQSHVTDAIRTIKKQLVILYDGLDEGWQPSAHSTAILGGLAAAIANIADSDVGIHVLLFIRDNMFRALAQLDGDFSRNIEANSLRLHWDERTLLGLVAKRIRIALGVTAENDIKIWNRFARGEIQHREGFKRCLRSTLYRPRDALVLFNAAYGYAVRDERDAIVVTDIDAAATQISRDRLEDLLKEYDGVLPGLRHFVQCFRGRRGGMLMHELLDLLDNAIKNTDIVQSSAIDFAILGNGREIASALFSVGFLGIHDNGSGKYRFSHDGTTSDIDFDANTLRVLIHPCYWRALELEGIEPLEDVTVEIHDDYDEKSAERDEADVSSLRFRRLGQILGELPQIPYGTDGANEFATWVRNTLKILFHGKIVGFSDAIGKFNNTQMIGMSASNRAKDGFWQRVKSSYEAGRVSIAVVNHEELKADDFAAIIERAEQVDASKFTLIVNRAPVEGLGQWERERVRSVWSNHANLLFILPVQILHRCMNKLRSPQLKMRFDYADEQMSKRLDTFERSYLREKKK